MKAFSLLLDPDADPLPESDGDAADDAVIAASPIEAGDLLASTSDGRVKVADKRDRVVGVALDSARPGAPLVMSSRVTPGFNEQVVHTKLVERETILRSTAEAVDRGLCTDAVKFVQQHFASGGAPVLRLVPSRGPVLDELDKMASDAASGEPADPQCQHDRPSVQQCIICSSNRIGF